MSVLKVIEILGNSKVSFEDAVIYNNNNLTFQRFWFFVFIVLVVAYSQFFPDVDRFFFKVFFINFGSVTQNYIF